VALQDQAVEAVSVVAVDSSEEAQAAAQLEQVFLLLDLQLCITSNRDPNIKLLLNSHPCLVEVVASAACL
jgi:hypothetical protein